MLGPALLERLDLLRAAPRRRSQNQAQRPTTGPSSSPQGAQPRRDAEDPLPCGCGVGLLLSLSCKPEIAGSSPRLFHVAVLQVVCQLSTQVRSRCHGPSVGPSSVSVQPFYKMFFPTSLCRVFVFKSSSACLLLILLPTHNTFTYKSLTHKPLTHKSLTYNTLTYKSVTHTSHNTLTYKSPTRNSLTHNSLTHSQTHIQITRTQHTHTHITSHTNHPHTTHSHTHSYTWSCTLRGRRGA